MTLISHSTDKSAQPASETLSDAPKSSPINTTDAPLQIPTIVEPKAQGSVASRASSSSVYSGLAPSAIQEAPTASSVLLPPDPHQESQSSKQPASEGDMNSLKPTGYRQFGWRSLPFLGSKKADDKKPMLSTMVQQEKKRQVSQDRTKRFFKNNRSEKRAKESAFIVRSLIVGPSGTNPPDAKTKAISRAKVEKVKSQLLQHKSANKVIAQLRALPPSDQLIVLDTGSDGQKITTAPSSPIHAVCLPYTEVEADERHFSHLKQESNDVQVTTTSERSVTVAEAAKMVTGVANASVAQLTALFEEMQIVSLISSPDFGLTQPGDGPGILAGALPSADTVLRGIQQITPQLLALGYATGKIILPSHEGKLQVFLLRGGGL